MVRTTRPPRFSVPELFPEIAALAKVTVRLHPRPGLEPPPNASKLGGQFLWPAEEPWPLCTEPGWQRDEHGPPHLHQYIPLLQLRRDDVPELPFRDGADIFQLLWCPNDHELTIAPECRVYWRTEAAIIGPLAASPTPSPVETDYLPRLCQFHPERVTEYPDYGDLSEELRDQLEHWKPNYEGAGIYESELSVARGIKIGGYVNWIQSPWPFECAHGHAMEHLLTIASEEFHWDPEDRWCPIEEAPPPGIAFDRFSAAAREIEEPTGIMLGDVGSLYVFICRQCPDLPIDYGADCH